MNFSYPVFFVVFALFSGCGITMRNVKTIPEAETVRTTFVMEVNIENAGNTEFLMYKTRIPVNINYRQRITDMRFDPAPKYIFDDGAERFVEYYLMHPQENTVLRLEFDMELYRYDVNTARMFDIDPSDELKPSRFLKEEKKIESKDPAIVKMAESVSGKDRYEIVEKIYQLVIDTLEYDMSLGHRKSWKGAKQSALQGTGVCSDYADLFVAICRAKGIPARYVSGFVVDENPTNVGHAWVEVYFEDKGWIRFDPTWGDNVLSDTDFFHNTPKYIEVLRSSRDTDTLYYYRGRPPKISSKVYSLGITEINTIHHKVTSVSFEDLLENPVFTGMLDRNRNRFTNYIDSLSINEKTKTKLTEISAVIFKNGRLDELETEQLKDFVSESLKKSGSGNRFMKQLYKRFIWMAQYRLELEKDSIANIGHGGVQS